MRNSKIFKSSSSSTTQSSSSVIDKVISDIDLLTLILTCLPVKSLLVFKSVSKRWLSIISDPNFAVTHFRRLNPKTTGFFLERNATTPTEYTYESFYHFLLLDGCTSKYEQTYEGKKEKAVVFTDGGDIKIPRIFDTTNDPEPGMYDSVGEFGVQVTQSCNGLLCCNRRTVFDNMEYPLDVCTYKTYIYNPTTRRYRCLPPSPLRDEREGYCIMVRSISLAFDPMKSIDYQVICIWGYEPMLSNVGDWDEDIENKYYLEIYSSKTNSWRKLNSTINGHSMSFLRSGVYWNGCLHWVATGEFVNGESSMYFDIGQELVKPLPASPNSDERMSEVRYFGECGGHLYLIEHLKSWHTHYDILKMEIDYSGWKLLHKLDLQSLLTMYPGRDGPFLDLKIFWRTIVFLEEDEKAESLAKLVVVVAGKEVISYDLKEMSVTKIHTFPGMFFFLDAPIGGAWGHLYHYIESLASV